MPVFYVEFEAYIEVILQLLCNMYYYNGSEYDQLNTNQTYVASNLRTTLAFILSRDLEVPRNYTSLLMSLVYNNNNYYKQ